MGRRNVFDPQPCSDPEGHVVELSLLGADMNHLGDYLSLSLLSDTRV